MLQQLLLPFSSRDMNTHSIWSFVSLTGDTVTRHANINLTCERDYICARAQLHRKKKNWIFVTSLWVHEIILNFVLIKHFSHDEILRVAQGLQVCAKSLKVPILSWYSHSLWKVMPLIQFIAQLDDSKRWPKDLFFLRFWKKKFATKIYSTKNHIYNKQENDWKCF